MASIPYRALKNKGSELSLLSEAGEYRNTSQYGTITVSTGSAQDFRFIIHGFYESLKDRACDIILRKRVERTDPEIWPREGRVCDRKISVVKTPSTKSHLASSCCFPSSKSMKIENQKYEMAHCALQVFPGPHAFLLVTDNRKATWKKCLKTITEVFGEEASSYVVVLIIGRTEPTRISSVNECEMCFLEDSDESVQDLFRVIENMTRNKESTFFIQSSYKNAFLLWEKEKHAEIKRETEKLLKEKEEQHDKKVNDLTEKLRIEDKHRKEMEDQHAKDIDNEVVEAKENHKIHIETVKSFVIDLIRLTKDSQEQPGVLSSHENELIKTLETGSETSLRNIFSSVVNKLEKKLKTGKLTKSYLYDVFSQQVYDQEKEIEDLKDVVEKLKEKTSELEQKLLEAEDRETQAIKQEETDRDLLTGLKKLEEKKLKEHEEKSQHVTSGSEQESSSELASPALFEEDKDRPLDEEAGEIKNKKEDSHNSGGFKLERRGSIEHEPPNMSEGQSVKEDSKARRKSNV